MSSSSVVVWHDLECGRYRADLPLWRELARAHPNGPVLDVGAGSGRVSLDLAREGRAVIALDRDPALLAAVSERATGLSVETICADARSFSLSESVAFDAVDLCLVPMQTIQLLGGPSGREGFLRAARASLRAGGLLACALVTDLEPFDCSGSADGPSPEIAHYDGVGYRSRAIRVGVSRSHIEIERERQIDDGPVERDLVRLDRLTAAELESEAAEHGLRPEPALVIEPTEEYSGSTVVILRG